MERYKRSKGKLLGSHQKCWLWGRNAVLATLHAGKWPILELYLDAALPDEAKRDAYRLADALKIPSQAVPDKQLARRCHSHEHQGYLARMAEFPYAGLDAIPAQPEATPLYVILDRIQDPFNFGSILRSAEAFGVDTVVIGTGEQVGVTAAVARSSAGAVNYIPIVRVANLTKLADNLAKRTIHIVAASEKAGTPAADHDFTAPTALVIGNEGRGIAPDLLARCDARVQIPQQGHTGSLNAAVAAAILLYEARRQRGDGATG